MNVFFWTSEHCDHEIERVTTTKYDTLHVDIKSKWGQTKVVPRLVHVPCPACGKSFNQVRDEHSDTRRKCLSCREDFVTVEYESTPPFWKRIIDWFYNKCDGNDFIELVEKIT